MPTSDFASVNVQEADFSVELLQQSLLQGNADEGAVVTFTGYVRSANDGRAITGMYLEHYPGMTESSIEAIMIEARQRWPILRAQVVHRIGQLAPGEQIVWVGVAAGHREAAHSACEFIMDYLKTRAPFWKKESGENGDRWVASRESDTDRAQRWRE